MADQENELPPDFGELDFYGVVAVAPELGLWQLTVKDAAALIAVDMWLAGKIEAEIPEADSYDPDDPALRSALSAHCRDFEARLTASVNRGALETSSLRRDLDDRLDAEKTLIHLNDLLGWLMQRGYEAGDAFDDYDERERDIYIEAIEEIHFLRFVHKRSKRRLQAIVDARRNPDEAGLDELRAAVRELAAENQRLEQDLAKAKKDRVANTLKQSIVRADRPLSTRARRTLLTIVAALCNRAGIEYEERGAAQRIKEATEKLGAPVDDGTIAKMLKDIPDALDVRVK